MKPLLLAKGVETFDHRSLLLSAALAFAVHALHDPVAPLGFSALLDHFIESFIDIEDFLMDPLAETIDQGVLFLA